MASRIFTTSAIIQYSASGVFFPFYIENSNYEGTKALKHLYRKTGTRTLKKNHPDIQKFAMVWAWRLRMNINGLSDVLVGK